MRKIVKFIIAAVTMLVVVGCAPTPAEEGPSEGEPTPPQVIEWRFHSAYTEGRLDYDLVKDWCDSVTEATEGRLKVTMYPGAALGFADSEMLRVCGGGSVEAFVAWGGYVARDEPALGILVPNGCDMFTREELVKINPTVEKCYKELYGEWNIRTLNVAPGPNCYDCVVSTEPMGSLEAMKGKKIRGWDVIQSKAFEKFGITLELFPQTEGYLALKTGMIDGGLFSVAAVVPLSLYEVADYVSVFTPEASPESIACNEDAFQALSADIQEIVLRVSEEHAERWSKIALDCSADSQHLEDMAAKGMNVLAKFSDEDMRALGSSAEEAWRARAEEFGPKAAKYQKIMLEALEQIRAQ